MPHSTVFKTLTISLAIAVLLVGLTTQFWLLGSICAFVILCALAWIGSPRPARQQETSVRKERPAEQQTVADNEVSPLSESGADELVTDMLATDRYALLLRPQIAANLCTTQMDSAQEALDDRMSIVPSGEVVLSETSYEDTREGAAEVTPRCVDIEAFHLDRQLVTNEQFQRFVDAGGYEQVALWEPSIWPAVLEFVDLTGFPGPRFWQDGKFPQELTRHPVVGISWFEACAYARWVGKRLPSSAEWIKTGTWPVSTEGEPPSQRRYPWGDSMDRNNANLWGVGAENTCPVDEYPQGISVGGVEQLIGNVWEWTHTSFLPDDDQLELPRPMKELHGGAFDTYFDSQADCQFRSADSPLARKHNIGFRCALGVCDVVTAYSGLEPDPEALVACGPDEEEY